MKTFDLNQPVTAKALNENLYKQFNVKINFDKYSRDQLEDYRNLLRTKVHQIENQANFNDLLTNETYQRDKYMLGVLNTRIKEMLGEARVISEKAVSKAQQQAAGAALAAKRAGKKPAKGPSAAMAKMSTKELEKFAGTKHKGLPKHKKTDESVEEGTTMRTNEAKKEKPDFLDMDKDGNKKEPMKKAVKDAKIKEGAKPDYIDLDKDGNKKEPMKKAAADAKKCCCKTKGKPACPVHGKKKVKETMSRQFRYDSMIITESIAIFLAEDEEGKAKAISAGSDMVSDFTSWMQRVGNYQTKSMIELSDSIRANFGHQEAETFKGSVASALEGALNALTAAREEINNAVAVLAGESPAPSTMGQEPEMEPDLDMAEPDELNAAPEDEFAASDAASGGMETAGRMRRESIERGNRLMKILGS